MKWNIENILINIQNTLKEMKETFAAGVNTIYDAIVARDVTPAGKSPSDLAAAIAEIGGDFTVYCEKGLTTSATDQHQTVELSEEIPQGTKLLISYLSGQTTDTVLHTFSGTSQTVNVGAYRITLTSTTVSGNYVSGAWRDIYTKIVGILPDQTF